MRNNNNKAKLIKKLLTTTSALAIIASNSNNAAAAGRNIGVGPNVNLTDPVVMFAPNDWLIFNAAGAKLTIDNPALIAGIDVANNPGAAIIIANLCNTTIGSISGVAGPIEIKINNAQLTLNGTAFGGIAANTYDKLGAITLNHDNGKLVVNANIELPQIQSGGVAGTRAIVEVNANKNVTLAGGINPGRPIGQLKLAANAQVDLKQNSGISNLATAIELANGSILTVHGKDITGITMAEEINGAAIDNGTLIFTNGDSTLTDISIGTTNRIHEIRVNKGAAAANITLETNAAINATQINFAGDDTLKTDSKITGKIDNITGVANKGTLDLTGILEVSGNIGETDSLKEIKLRSAANITFNSTIIKAATISIGEAGGNGKLTLMPAANMDLLQGGNVINFQHADSELVFVNNPAANRTFTLHGNLTGAADNKGKIRLSSLNAGNTLTIAKAAAETIGIAAANRIKELIIEGPGINTINTKVYSKTITLDNIGPVNLVAGIDQGNGGTINVNQNVTVSGNITGTDTTINLNNKTLTHINGNIDLRGNVVVNTTINPGVGIGHIVVDGRAGASNLDLSHAAAVTINLNGTSNLADVGKSYDLIEVANGGNVVVGGPAPVLNSHDTNHLPWVYDNATKALSNLAPGVAPAIPPVAPPVPGVAFGITVAPLPVVIPTAGNILLASPDKVIVKVNEGNQYVKWVLDPATNKITSVDDSINGLKADFSNTAPEIVQAFLGVDPKSDAGDVVNTFGTLSQKNPALQQEAAERLSVVAPTMALANVADSSVKAVHYTIDSRINNLFAGTQGVSAGDEISTPIFGVWGRPFYGQATQKKQGKAYGYKNKSTGSTVGFDGLVNDYLTLGLAVTFMDSKLAYNNQKSGDKTKAKSFLLSIYGIQELSSNWFMQGIISFGSSKIRNYEQRIISATLARIAEGKYTSNTYNGEVLAGYKYILSNNTMITPMLGLRYGHFDDTKYTETGALRRNLTVGKKSMNKFEGILGIKSTLSWQEQKVILIPEWHAFVDYSFINKTPKIDARLNGALAPMPVRTTKQAKTLFNVGTSISLKYQMMEYGIGYDANIAKKYLGHQGTLKVRANF